MYFMMRDAIAVKIQIEAIALRNDRADVNRCHTNTNTRQ